LLPEVEVLRRDLEREVVGRRVKEAEVRPSSNAMKIIRHHGRRKDFQDLLIGSRIDRAVRKAGQRPRPRGLSRPCRTTAEDERL
jgi:formamidopyrimidine-DNA glycosylase